MIDSDELRDQDCDDTCSETRWRIADEIDLLVATIRILRKENRRLREIEWI